MDLHADAMNLPSCEAAIALISYPWPYSFSVLRKDQLARNEEVSYGVYSLWPKRSGEKLFF